MEAGRLVSRDEAAKAVGVSRALAAFHLDRLVEGGLLVPEYRRLSGRTGPGAGRPAKLYRRGDRDIEVSLPERQYEILARLFAETIEGFGEQTAPETLGASARHMGDRAGRAARKRAGRRPSQKRLREALVETLAERGYQPRVTSGEIRLGNCPFDALVDSYRPLVCGMNLALAEGLLSGLGSRNFEASLDPRQGNCCVVIGEPAGRQGPAPA